MIRTKRDIDIDIARNKMSMELLDWADKNNLTLIEYVDFLSREISGSLRSALKQERDNEISKS